MNKPLSIPEIKVPALSAETLDRVRQFENALEKCPQVEINVESVLFAGIYARTIKIPAGVRSFRFQPSCKYQGGAF